MGSSATKGVVFQLLEWVAWGVASIAPAAFLHWYLAPDGFWQRLTMLCLDAAVVVACAVGYGVMRVAISSSREEFSKKRRMEEEGIES